MIKEDLAIWLSIIAGTIATVNETLYLLDRLRKPKKPHKRRTRRKRKRK